ncbi:sensor histidine kinase [Gorillibacterium timonense]|uniref:sensor histidine kinase n=1 Tax=Gorillibacterium timonense TaxID=1689269 RepID=UPI00071D7A89|nr:HAMP domain-containing sensor histidine kinase [Gorillibacterium timonense]
MSIRVRLLLSFAAMLLVPLILFLFAALLWGLVYRGDVNTLMDAYNVKAVISSMERHDERLLKELRRTATRNPDLLTQQDYLQEMDGELKLAQSKLIVRIGGSPGYVSEELRTTGILVRLPEPVEDRHDDEDSVVRLEGRVYTLDGIGFRLSDGRSGDLFVVHQEEPLVDFARRFFPFLVISLLVIFVLTNLTLTYLVSRGILRPLKELRQAVEKIKDGNLEFKLLPGRKDEIGQLSDAFEAMRGKLKESIDKQLQYEENRKVLISNISHDLKTPITSIRGYVDGIRDGVADTPEKMERYMSTIAIKTDDIDHLIDELFLYSKLDLNRLPFHFEAVEIGTFLADCTDDLRFDLEKKGIELCTDISNVQLLMVRADREKVKRVITNIVGNCIKYMDKPKKTIRLRAVAAGIGVRIEIADNGPGIEPSALPFVFDRFYRAEQSRNSRTGGSGLGLAIAKQIVEGHGGEIGAASEQGEGTTIYFTLPTIAS